MASNPQVPNLDPHPLDPNASDNGGNNTPSPDNGKDLTYLDPDVSVAWDIPPSFNLDPSGSSGGGPSPDSVAAGGPFAVNLTTLRTGEQTMLGAVRNSVNEYEQLKSKVLASSAVFGPATIAPHNITLLTLPNGGHPNVLETAGHGGPWSTNPNNPDTHGLTDDDKEINNLANAGQQFAAEMNPMQEKALENIANLLELTGSYITAINTAGQAYAHTDRSAEFPPPPPGSPVG
jgi:hypothetical protein